MLWIIYRFGSLNLCVFLCLVCHESKSKLEAINKLNILDSKLLFRRRRVAWFGDWATDVAECRVLCSLYELMEGLEPRSGGPFKKYSSYDKIWKTQKVRITYGAPLHPSKSWESGLYFGAVFSAIFCLSSAEYNILIRAPSEATSIKKLASWSWLNYDEFSGFFYTFFL